MNTFQDEFSKIQKEYFMEEWSKKRQLLKKALKSRPVVLYGLGFFGEVIVRNFALEGISVECFCDSKKRGIDLETKLGIISPQELMDQYPNANIVISVANPKNEKSVYDTVVSLGFQEKQIFHFRDAYQFIRKSRVEQVSLSYDEFQDYLEGYRRAYEFFDDDVSRRIILEIINSYLFHRLFTYEPPKDSYFPEQFLFHDNEIFIDGGLYTGDTTEEFIRRVNGKYSKIIGFDIDEKNLLEARQNLSSQANVEIISKGLWDTSSIMSAELGIMAGSNIKEDAGSLVELVSLDEVFSDMSVKDYPTFIKLDVEGSEKQALLGAKNIIREAAPKLAVCVYHKPEDIYIISELIREINPNYRFFLKHYSPYIWDTVLYAY